MAIKSLDSETVVDNKPTSGANFAKFIWPLTSSKENINALDGLRGLAALMVVVVHIVYFYTLNNSSDGVVSQFITTTQPFWDFCGKGVRLFFMLSGFLLFLPFAGAIQGFKKFPATGKFYLRRALRILPAYWFTLFVIVLFNKGSYGLADHTQDVVLHIFLVHNVSYNTFETLNPPFWTMAVESQFYLLLPLFGYLLYKLSLAQKTGIIVFLTVLSFSSTALFGLLYFFFPSLEATIDAPLSTLSNMTFFGTGMLVGNYYVKIKNNLYPTSYFNFGILGRNRVFLSLGGILFVLILLVAFLEGQYPNVKVQLDLMVKDPLLALLFAALLMSTLSTGSICWHIFSSRFMRFIGVISYSLYIWHFSIIKNVVAPLADKFSMGSQVLLVVLYIVLTFATTIPFAYLSYMIVERPFIKFRKKQY